MKLITLLFAVLLCFTAPAFSELPSNEIETSAKQWDILFILSMGFIGFAAIAIIVSQILVALQEEKQYQQKKKIEALQKQIKALQQEMETLRQERTASP